MKSTIKSTIMIIGAIFAAPNAFAVNGICLNNPSYHCRSDSDCPNGDRCMAIGSGGSGSSCTNSNQCQDGYYCKITSGSSGICTPYPDCSDGCPDCESTAWSAYSTGYQKRTVATCNTTMCTCSKKTEYRCATGYYGTTTNGKSGCTQCPPSNGISATSDAGATLVTQCYLPSGATGTDATGTFIYTTNCYY